VPAAGCGCRKENASSPRQPSRNSTSLRWLADSAGLVATEFVWAALDCPGAWSAEMEGRPMVLGRMAARVDSVPSAGEECVVMGQLLGGEGRKTWTATTAYGADGRLLGLAHQTWITLPAPAAT